MISLPRQRAFVSQDMAVLVYECVNHHLLCIAGDADQGATITDVAHTVAIFDGRMEANDDWCVSREVPPQPPQDLPKPRSQLRSCTHGIALANQSAG